MTATHRCPHCRGPFTYDPGDYHRQVTCGGARCGKPFGFMFFPVSERREKEVRREVKAETEARLRSLAARGRRARRAAQRAGAGQCE